MIVGRHRLSGTSAPLPNRIAPGTLAQRPVSAPHRGDVYAARRASTPTPASPALPKPAVDYVQIYDKLRISMDHSSYAWDRIKFLTAGLGALCAGLHFAAPVTQLAAWVTSVWGHVPLAEPATLSNALFATAMGLFAFTGVLWNHARPSAFVARHLPSLRANEAQSNAQELCHDRIREVHDDLKARQRVWGAAGVLTVMASLLPMFYSVLVAPVTYALPILIGGTVVGTLGLHQASRFKKAAETIEDLQGILKLDLAKKIKRGFLRNFADGRGLPTFALLSLLPLMAFGSPIVTKGLMLAATAIGLYEYVYNLMFKESTAGTRRVVMGLGLVAGGLLAFLPTVSAAVGAMVTVVPPVSVALFLPFVGAAAYFVIRAQHDRDIQTASNDFLKTMGGFAYVPLLFAHFHFLRGIGGGNLWLVGALCLSIAGDMLALALGSSLGKGNGLLARNPFAEVSPKKTVAGFMGQAIGAFGAAWVFTKLAGQALGLGVGDMLALGLIGTFLSPIGDLFESMLKRMVGVKDSGGIFRGRTLSDPMGRNPDLKGHGGLLDRLDSHAFAVGAVFYWVTFVKPHLFAWLAAIGW